MAMDGGDDGAPPPLHIAVFPWLAFGHMLPLLELSKSLAKLGHHISYLATPKNIARLPSGDLAARRIEFVPLSLPRAAGLPDGAEATIDVAPEQIQHLRVALGGLRGPFEEFLRRSDPKPDWVIVDIATDWAPPAAAEIGRIPCCFFTVFNAAFLAFLGPTSEYHGEGRSRRSPKDFTSPPVWAPNNSDNLLAQPLYAARQFVAVYDEDVASGVSDTRRFASTIESCQAVAPRTCNEVEAAHLELLRELYGGKPVLPVGLLLPQAAPEEEEGQLPLLVSSSSATADADAGVLEWLDKHPAKSVVYMAFGSEVVLSAALLHELALGVESSGLPFLWAFRARGGDATELLPEGFEERTEGKGMVARSWLPQKRVLAHPSVGGFLSHAGWSSIIESLRSGLPMALLPVGIDQHANARVAVGMGIAVEVVRDEEDGSFAAEDVRRALRIVVVEEEGEHLRRSAAELMRDVFADNERQEQYVREFARYLQEHRGCLDH